ncbi:MAG: cell division initiation protein [Actinomycetota bacterium]|jgi:DivIVA domain-containing protein|nr:cell division initiation protein [Actinomycetota bacterium]
MMPILPEDIATATFNRVNRHGYSPDEVEGFLRKVAVDYGAALEKMFTKPDDADEMNVGDEVNMILRTTRDSATALVRRAREQAEALHNAAVEQARDLDGEAATARLRAFEKSTNDSKYVKEEADKYAFELRSRTERESRQMVGRAEERMQQLHAYQQQLGNHLGEIERLVDGLRSEIDVAGKGLPVSEEPIAGFAAPTTIAEPADATAPTTRSRATQGPPLIAAHSSSNGASSTS